MNMGLIPNRDYFIHKDDLPDGFSPGVIVAVDTEAMGLKHSRDRLCLVQLYSDNVAHLVYFDENSKYNSPNLKKIFEDKDILKVFHFARFDVGIIKYYLKANVNSIYCTKIASVLARTYTYKHSLRELCWELLKVRLDKQQQSSDWGACELSTNQIEYAIADVAYLSKIKFALDKILRRENRYKIAQKVFDFLPYRVSLDLQGWDIDIFSLRPFVE